MTGCTASRKGATLTAAYDCYCYLPLYVTCGRHVLCGRLRPSSVDPAAGATEELERIVGRIRESYPQVRVIRAGRADHPH